jgi:hypothetical protein
MTVTLASIQRSIVVGWRRLGHQNRIHFDIANLHSDRADVVKMPLWEAGYGVTLMTCYCGNLYMACVTILHYYHI